MKKSTFLTSATLVAGLLAVVSAKAISGFEGASAPAAPAAAGTDTPTFYATIESSDSWTNQGTYVMQAGVYKFTPATDPVAASAVQASSFATYGAVCADGYLYYLSGYSVKGNVNTTWHKMDIDTWKVVASSGHSNPTKSIAFAITHDYTTSTTYAVSPTFGSSGDRNGLMLRTVDLESGEFSDVAPLARSFAALACDANGQLFAFERQDGFPHKVTLHKLDKKTGESTEIGDLGVNQKSDFCGASFDLETGKLYWHSRTFTYNSYYEETYTSAVYEIDTATGEAKIVKVMPGDELLSSLFFVDSNPAAPKKIDDATFTFSNSTHTAGNVKFTLPSKTYAGNALSGTVSVEIGMDGSVVETKTGLTPGAQFTSSNFEMPAGAHTFTIVAINADGKRSLKTKVATFSGVDTPEKVSDIKVEVSKRGDVATITWKAPTIGANNGHIETSNLTYTVRRRPDGTILANGQKETTFTDTPDVPMGVTQYEIIASADGLNSASAHSELVLAGKARAIPYLETFDSNTAFLSFTTIDVTGDGSDMGNKWMYYTQTKEAVWWINYDDYRPTADDWIITPTLDVATSRVYRLDFETRGYSSGQSTCTYDVYIGETPTVEAMKTRIVKKTYIVPRTNMRITGFFNPKGDECRIGFHVTNDGYDHTSLDNIHVVDYGPTTIPAYSENIEFSKNNGTLTVSATMPTMTMGGAALTSLTKASLYRAGTDALVATVNNPAPGAKVSFDDKTPAHGVNTYYIVAENSDGKGVQTAGEYNILPPAPVEVDYVGVYSNGSDATIEWSYPANMLGADGTKLDESELRFDIVRTIGSETVTVAQGVKGNSYVDKNVDRYFGNLMQKMVIYKVTSVTDGGSSLQTLGSGIVGQTIELPYTNTFDNGTEPFMNITGYAWQRQNTGYDPLVHGGIDDNWLLTFINSSGTIYSPRLNLSSLLNPRVTFYLYCTNDSRYSGSYLQIGVEAQNPDGSTKAVKMLPDKFSNAADESGWQQFTCDLSEFKDCTRASLVFSGVKVKGSLHIDKVEVTGDRPDNDLRMMRIIGPAQAVAGRANQYAAVVNNNGTLDCGEYKAEFFAGDVSLGTRTGTIASGETAELKFEFTPSIREVGSHALLRAVVTTTGDTNDSNDQAEMEVDITAPNIPYITTLSVTGDDDQITLEWEDADSYPNSINVVDDFESYSDFAIDGLGDWTVADLDNAVTIQGISGSAGDFTWLNAGLPQAWIVFNPEQVRVTSLCNAYSGKRCLVSFCCAASRNDDWLISPLLIGSAQTISFQARALHPTYLQETLQIMASSTSSDVTDFEEVSSVRVNSTNWREFKVELPAGTRYFALRNISSGQFGLMLDNIDYTPAQEPVDLWGFNVYRDGQRIATEIGDMTYTDTEGEPRKLYDYNVTAVYAQGESVFSNTISAGKSEIVDIQSAADGISIEAVANGAMVKGAAATTIQVFTIDGKLLRSFTGSDIEFIGLEKGVFIVKAGATRAKLLVK